MTNIYEKQICQVSWGSKESNAFRVKNGVRQGGVSSAILFAVYIDDLVKRLRKSRIGCSIFGVFYGVFVYADDIILLSASRNGLQKMVDNCQKFVSSKNLKFGTSPNPKKSKTVWKEDQG